MLLLPPPPPPQLPAAWLAAFRSSGTVFWVGTLYVMPRLNAPGPNMRVGSPFRIAEQSSEASTHRTRTVRSFGAMLTRYACVE